MCYNDDIMRYCIQNGGVIDEFHMETNAFATDDDFAGRGVGVLFNADPCSRY